MTAILAVLILLPQETFDSNDPVEARRAIEAAIRKGDEGGLEAASKTSRGAGLALAEIRAQKRLGPFYPPSLSITYEAKDRPTSEVISHLEKLFEKRIELSPGMKESLSINLKGATFLEAIDALESALGGSLQIRPDKITGQKSMPFNQGPSCYWRHFKISLGSFTESRDVISGGTEASFYFTTWIDGRPRAVGSGAFLITHAETDSGESLVRGTKMWDGAHWEDYQKHQAFGCHIEVNAPASSATRLILLRGVKRFYFPEKPRFADLPLADKSRSIQGVNLSFRIDEAAADGSLVKAVATIPDWKKPHVRPQISDFQIVGKDGRTLPARGSVAGPVEVATLQLAFELPAGFEGTHLRVRHFEAIAEHDFPFEFRDLPLR